MVLTIIVALPSTAATDALASWRIPRPIGATATMAVVVAAVAGLVYSREASAEPSRAPAAVAAEARPRG